MWEKILKRKSLVYDFLKKVTIALGKKYSGETLTRDQFNDEFLESVRAIYSAKHMGVGKERIRNDVVKILKRNNMLEIKRVREYDPVVKINVDQNRYVFK